MLQLLEDRTAAQIIWNSPAWEVCPFCPIYYFFQSFISIVWTCGYLFYTMCYNPILLHLFCYSDCSSLGHWELFQWLLCPFDIFPSLCVCFCFFSQFFRALLQFLALQDPPGLSCIFSAPVLDSTIFPKSPGSFYWRRLLETKTWALGIVIATALSLFLGPLS